MKLISFIFFAGALAATAATEEQINKRFAVQPGGTLVVDVDFGSVDIRTNATSEVVADVWRKIGRKTKAAEEAFLRDNPVEFVQDGSTVTIRSHNKAKTTWSWTGRNQNEAKYTITLPSQFSTQIKTGGGNVSVADLAGNAKVRTGGGNLALARLHGPTDGGTGGGSIKAEDCEGALKLETGGGGIEVAGGSGTLDSNTGGGSVTVRRFHGPAHVGSGGGGLSIENVDGAIDASTGGGSISAVLLSEVAQSVKLSTGGGGINVSVPGSAAFELDAKTDGGSVSSDLPVMVSGKMEDGRLQGPVNGGGKVVSLRSGGGSIHVRKL